MRAAQKARNAQQELALLVRNARRELAIAVALRVIRAKTRFESTGEARISLISSRT